MKNIISGVYVITNVVNGKQYIGSSSNINERRRCHFLSLSNGNHHNSHLQNSYRKYGKENFSFQIIEQCDNFALIEREQFYIDTLHPEYNARLTADSNLGLKRSDEARQKMSDAKNGYVPWNKGKTFSEESKHKMSESSKGQIAWNKGKKTGPLSDETRRKLSIAKKGKARPEEVKRKISASHQARSLLKRFLQNISGT